jgi:tetratricopeptide (TPR) repeat protein
MPEWKARVSSGLGDAAYLQGKVTTARRHFACCVELAERHDLLRVIPANRCMIADCMAFDREFDEALAEIAAARTLAISIGDRFCEMFSLQNESFLLLYAGRLAEAESPTEAALELAIKLGTRRYEAFILADLAQLRLSHGHPGEALKMLNSAMTLAETTGIGFCGPLICGALATVHGPGEQGRSWINRGEELLQRGGLVHNHVYFRSTAIEWAINTCDWRMADRIANELSEYSADEPMPYVDFVVRRARAFASLARDPDDLQAIETVRQLVEIARAVDFRVTWPRSFSGLH